MKGEKGDSDAAHWTLDGRRGTSLKIPRNHEGRRAGATAQRPSGVVVVAFLATDNLYPREVEERVKEGGGEGNRLESNLSGNETLGSLTQEDVRSAQSHGRGSEVRTLCVFILWMCLERGCKHPNAKSYFFSHV